MPAPRVLVTGGSGFIAGHVILAALDSGAQVRATLRSLDTADRVRTELERAGMPADAPLTFVVADLLADDGWAAATDGIDVVLHVASPVMPGHVEHEDDVIVPAREGTLRVLRAARDAGVPRVVLTSAFHAVSWGHPHDAHVFTEDDWTVLDGPGVDAYGKSKTLAERAAWEFVEREPDAPALTTMLPVAVMGPLLGGAVSGANHIVQNLIEGDLKTLPDLYIPIVDVRDVARAHVLAMTNPDAAGQRFLLSNGPALSMRDIATTIRDDLGDAAPNVSTRAVPNFVIRIAALFSAQARSVVPDLGWSKRTSNERARRVLGWAPRDPREAVRAAAESLVGRRPAGIR
ncbi:SDR family oxidoreductase [Agromyces seonyuensis]|uniref:NAD-dependent epimerase/dehydratase family protein n=1 Tax=Agromyces seonyuensis TaxID=2662446 RepID=A0A6I4NWG5_9MICO|nr:aldehyde reductase [Agromyces seonyuensis]MWB97422.1 NAD-dependent epimerase/dehydratase family protein [Agromyces seonyuensis]